MSFSKNISLLTLIFFLTATQSIASTIFYDFEDKNQNLDNYNEYVQFPYSWNYATDTNQNTVLSLSDPSGAIIFGKNSEIASVNFDFDYSGDYEFYVNYGNNYSDHYLLSDFDNTKSMNFLGSIQSTSGEMIFLNTIYFQTVSYFESSDFFYIDDMTISTINSNPLSVPLPASGLFLISALIALTGARKIRKFI